MVIKKKVKRKRKSTASVRHIEEVEKRYKTYQSRMKALKRNVKRRKGKYATARDLELMFGY